MFFLYSAVFKEKIKQKKGGLIMLQAFGDRKMNKCRIPSSGLHEFSLKDKHDSAHYYLICHTDMNAVLSPAQSSFLF